MTEKFSRRGFIKTAGAGAMAMYLTPMAATSFAAGSPNEKLTVAVAGIRSRGMALAVQFAKLKNCQVKYVIDVDSRYLENAAQAVAKAQGERKPQMIKDFRKALEDKDIDAIVIATPDHWHAPMAIEAVKAGKHVYLEKPCSHNPAEGELLVAAQKKYGKLIQMGNQRRSLAVCHQMIDEIGSGVIGNVYMANCWYANNRGTIGFGKETAVPDYLDWDLWQGPAARVKYRDNVHPYNWHWFWNWGTGEALNNGTHEIDVARWVLGEDFPKKVASLGGRYHHVGKDDWQSSDTQTINIEFESGKLISWEGRSCNKYNQGAGRGVILYGTNGTIEYYSDRYNILDANNKKVKSVGGAQARANTTNTVDPGLQDNHAGNFVEAVRGNEQLNSPIDEGHKSTLLCQLGNIAMRSGATLDCDTSNGHIIGNAEAARLWSREYAKGWEPKI